MKMSVGNEFNVEMLMLYIFVLMFHICGAADHDCEANPKSSSYKNCGGYECSRELIPAHKLTCLYHILASHKFASVEDGQSPLFPQRLKCGKPSNRKHCGKSDFHWGYFGVMNELLDEYQRLNGYGNESMNRRKFLEYKRYSMMESVVPIECVNNSISKGKGWQWIVRTKLVRLGEPIHVFCSHCSFKASTNEKVKSLWVIPDRDLGLDPARLFNQTNGRAMRFAEYIHRHWVDKRLLAHRGRENRARFANMAERWTERHVDDPSRPRPDSRLLVNSDPSNVNEFIPTMNGFTFVCAQNEMGTMDLKPTRVIVNVDTLMSLKQHKDIIGKIGHIRGEFDRYTQPKSVTKDNSGRPLRLHLNQISHNNMSYDEMDWSKFNLNMTTYWTDWSCCSGCCLHKKPCNGLTRQRSEYCKFKRLHPNKTVGPSEGIDDSATDEFPDPVDFIDQEGFSCGSACQWKKLDRYLRTPTYESEGIPCFSTLTYYTFPVLWRSWEKLGNIVPTQMHDLVGLHRQVETCPFSTTNCEKWKECGHCQDYSHCLASLKGDVTVTNDFIHGSIALQQMRNRFEAAIKVKFDKPKMSKFINSSKDYAIKFENRDPQSTHLEWYKGNNTDPKNFIEKWNKQSAKGSHRVLIFNQALMLLKITQESWVIYVIIGVLVVIVVIFIGAILFKFGKQLTFSKKDRDNDYNLEEEEKESEEEEDDDWMNLKVNFVMNEAPSPTTGIIITEREGNRSLTKSKEEQEENVEENKIDIKDLKKKKIVKVLLIEPQLEDEEK